MAREKHQDLEEFFKLFHEPFSIWAADLQAIRERDGKKGVARDEEILHFASLVERLTNLLRQEFKEKFSLPLPPNLWSAQILRDHFREMNEVARFLLTGREEFKPKTRMKLEWLAELNLESVIRERQ